MGGDGRRYHLRKEGKRHLLTNFDMARTKDKKVCNKGRERGETWYADKVRYQESADQVWENSEGVGSKPMRGVVGGGG